MTHQEEKRKAYLHLDLYEGKSDKAYLDIEGDGILEDLAFMLCKLRQDQPELFAYAEELYTEMQRHFSALNDNNYLTRN